MTKPGVCVLIAEDDECIRFLLVSVLDDAGFDVLEAKDGAEALRLIDNPDGVEALVSDINMPGSNGVAVARRLREVHPNVPIILISGRTDQLARDRFTQPFRTFPKPFKLNAIVGAVRDMLKAPVKEPLPLV